MSSIDGRRSRLSGWLALMRLSNLPTVLSNIWTGLALGYFVLAFGGAAPVLPSQWHIAPLLVNTGWAALLAGGLFYAGGMILNDITDRRFDQRDRADRPLPAGLISIHAARLAVVVCVLGGLVLTAIYGRQALTVGLLLVGAIAAYNLSHKYFTASIVFMGLCRALLYPLGVAALLHATNWPIRSTTLVWSVSLPWLTVVGVYVALATWVARGEHTSGPGWRRWLAVVMTPLPLLGVLRAVPPAGWPLFWSLAAGLGLVGWLLWCAYHVLPRQPNTPGAVQRWLAGLCLIDAYFLTLINLATLAVVPLVLFVTTRVLQRRIIGT